MVINPLKSHLRSISGAEQKHMDFFSTAQQLNTSSTMPYTIVKTYTIVKFVTRHFMLLTSGWLCCWLGAATTVASHPSEISYKCLQILKRQWHRPKPDTLLSRRLWRIASYSYHVDSYHNQSKTKTYIRTLLFQHAQWSGGIKSWLCRMWGNPLHCRAWHSVLSWTCVLNRAFTHSTKAVSTKSEWFSPSAVLPSSYWLCVINHRLWLPVESPSEVANEAWRWVKSSHNLVIFHSLLFQCSSVNPGCF